MTILKFKNIDRVTKSKIIGQLSKDDAAALTAELTLNIDKFGTHPNFHNGIKRFNAFDNTSSMHIHNMDMEFKLYDDNRPAFPNTMEIITRYLKEDMSKLARVYWLRVEPGQFVRLHADTACNYHHTVKRYQFFLDAPRDFVVVTDGELWNLYDDKKLTNAVLEFNKEDYHYYANHCKGITCYMLIADFGPYSR